MLTGTRPVTRNRLKKGDRSEHNNEHAERDRKQANSRSENDKNWPTCLVWILYRLFRVIFRFVCLIKLQCPESIFITQGTRRFQDIIFKLLDVLQHVETRYGSSFIASLTVQTPAWCPSSDPKKRRRGNELRIKWDLGEFDATGHLGFIVEILARYLSKKSKIFHGFVDKTNQQLLDYLGRRTMFPRYWQDGQGITCNEWCNYNCNLLISIGFYSTRETFDTIHTCVSKNI